MTQNDTNKYYQSYLYGQNNQNASTNQTFTMPAEKGRKKSYKVISVIFGVLIGIIIFFIFVPAFAYNCFYLINNNTSPNEPASINGYAFAIADSDNLSPAINKNDVIILDTNSKENLTKDDIIAFYNQNAKTDTPVLVNKIDSVSNVANSTEYSVNNTNDTLHVTTDNIIGVYEGTKIPKLGAYCNFIKSGPGLLLCILIPVVLIIGYDVFRRKLYFKNKSNIYTDLWKQWSNLKADKVNSANLNNIQTDKLQNFSSFNSLFRIIILAIISIIIGVNFFLFNSRAFIHNNYITLNNFGVKTINDKDMEPTFNLNDLLIFHVQDNFQTGDCIIYIENKEQVVARIINFWSSETCVAQGDSPDSTANLVYMDQITGKVVWYVPFIGILFNDISIYIILLIFVGLLLLSILKEVKFWKKNELQIELIEDEIQELKQARAITNLETQSSLPKTSIKPQINIPKKNKQPKINVQNKVPNRTTNYINNSIPQNISSNINLEKNTINNKIQSNNNLAQNSINNKSAYTQIQKNRNNVSIPKISRQQNINFAKSAVQAPQNTDKQTLNTNSNQNINNQTNITNDQIKQLRESLIAQIQANMDNRS